MINYYRQKKRHFRPDRGGRFYVNAEPVTLEKSHLVGALASALLKLAGGPLLNADSGNWSTSVLLDRSAAGCNV